MYGQRNRELLQRRHARRRSLRARRNRSSGRLLRQKAGGQKRPSKQPRTTSQDFITSKDASTWRQATWIVRWSYWERHCRMIQITSPPTCWPWSASASTGTRRSGHLLPSNFIPGRAGTSRRMQVLPPARIEVMWPFWITKQGQSRSSCRTGLGLPTDYRQPFTV
jgi:hypothetical protein